MSKTPEQWQERFDTLERRRTDPGYEPGRDAPATPAAPEPEPQAMPTRQAIIGLIALVLFLIVIALLFWHGSPGSAVM